MKEIRKKILIGRKNKEVGKVAGKKGGRRNKDMTSEMEKKGKNRNF